MPKGKGSKKKFSSKKSTKRVDPMPEGNPSDEAEQKAWMDVEEKTTSPRKITSGASKSKKPTKSTQSKK